jgi:hypothetical protein
LGRGGLGDFAAAQGVVGEIQMSIDDEHFSFRMVCFSRREIRNTVC